MNPLAQLRDIHLTETVTWWPPSLGWWLLLFVSLFIVVSTFRWLKNRRQLTLAKRQALSALENDSINTVQEINILLKRVCMSYFGQETIASMHGQKWVEFLLKQSKPSDEQGLQSEFIKLADAPYQKESSANIEQCKHAARTWIKKALPPTKKQTMIAKETINV